MKKISIIVIVFISILMPNIVFASNYFQIGLTADKIEVRESETVTISLSLENLNVTTGEQGIGSYLAKIEYDTEIFENVVFSGNTNWEGSMANGNITGVTVDGRVVKQPETIATLSLTVKRGALLGNTTVTISNFVGSDAVNDILTNSKSIEIIVIKEDNNQKHDDLNINDASIENNKDIESNTSNNNNTNSDTSDNTNNDVNNNNNKVVTDNVASNEKLSQSEHKMVLYGLFMVIILLLIVDIYIYCRKIKPSGKIGK